MLIAEGLVVPLTNLRSRPLLMLSRNGRVIYVRGIDFRMTLRARRLSAWKPATHSKPGMECL
jgi:hypothetical protein